MSQQEYPNFGYVVKASNLLLLLPSDSRAEFEALLVEENFEIAAKLFREHSNFPEPHFFRLGDEDTPDEDMERGELYAMFDEDDLFEKKLSLVGESMQQLGVEPKLQRWSIWG